MACHIYYDGNRPLPQGFKQLYGLGPKFIVQRAQPTNNLHQSINRITNDMRRIYAFRNAQEEEGNYIPQLDITKHTKFKAAAGCLEEAMGKFTSAIITLQRRYRRKRSTNLTPLQWRTMDSLINETHFISLQSDKNCGGVLCRRGWYNSKACSEHLTNIDVYRRISKAEAQGLHQTLRYKINMFINKHRDVMSEAERKYLRDSLAVYPTERFPRFRMTLKVHKNPAKFRPIVCCAGTFMNGLSKWVDYWLQQLKKFIPSYIKDSATLLRRLRALGRLPSEARLFTADAQSMYTNIDTNHAIEVIGNWLDNLETNGSLEDNGLGHFPIAAVKEAMKLVMENNIFEFGDMYFHQLTGTAMGTSAAVMWATIYFAVHEEFLLNKYRDELHLCYARFVDDMFGVWTGTHARWLEFKDDTDNFGLLRWDHMEHLSNSVVFMDLTISIDPNGNIITKTYQKPINLYQYLPPHSAHPPHIIKGVVFSLLRSYKFQNTYRSDYVKQTTLLYQRLVARGWKREYIKSLILAADTQLHSAAPPPTQQNEPALTNKELLILHWEYHPNDIPKKDIRALYDLHCKEILTSIGIKKFIIAYHAAPNLNSLTTKAKLIQEPGKEASKYYEGELS